MADFPVVSVPPLFLHTWTRWSGGLTMVYQGSITTIVSTTWPSANLAKYIPMFLPFYYNVRRVFWVNGSSVTTTNRDFGIYTASGTRIYSTGSIAASVASVPQYVTPSTDLWLSPGNYYFALSTSTVTANRGPEGATNTTLARERLCGFLQEVSALPLPATMTPAVVSSLTFPLCGVTSTTTGFA